MFKIIETNNLDDYFTDINLRHMKGVYFYRLIGYNDEYSFYEFAKKLYIKSVKSGVYFDEPMKNPSEPQIIDFYNETKFENFDLNDSPRIFREISKWMPQMNVDMQKEVTETLVFVLNEVKQYAKATDGILKNIYIKIMCWIKMYFIDGINRIQMGATPVVMYDLEISKHEIYCLRAMSLMGFDVVYINYISDETYKKSDPSDKYSSPIYGSIRKAPSKKYNEIDVDEYIKLEKLKGIFENNKIKIITNEWCKDDLFVEIARSKKDRNIRCATAGPNDILNLFFLYIGYDNFEEYSNRVYNLREICKNKSSSFLLIENKISNPSTEEIDYFNKVKSDNEEGLILKIGESLDFIKDPSHRILVQMGFRKLIDKNKNDVLARLSSIIIKLLCWIKRYCEETVNFAELPLIVFYGVVGKYETLFMEILADMGCDVVYISCDVHLVPSLEANSKANIVQLSNSKELAEFPRSELKVRVSTIAHQASRELDDILYNGDVGVFRNRQYVNSKAVTLKTTYEEISILWKNDPKFRTGFEVKNNCVYVPNIFAKVKGVDAANPNKYWEGVRSLITDKTLIVTQFPFTKDMEKEQKNRLSQCYDGDVLNPEKVKNSSEYKFEYIDDDVQSLMIDKIQELINTNMLVPMKNLHIEILSCILCMNKEIVRLIQQFDFTKEIPKILIIDVNENMMTLNDCIILSYLNIIGFDIAIFTPTGYKNIEKFVKAEFYDTFVIGEYEYNLRIPSFSSKDKDSIIKKIFRF